MFQSNFDQSLHGEYATYIPRMFIKCVEYPMITSPLPLKMPLHLRWFKSLQGSKGFVPCAKELMAVVVFGMNHSELGC
jgi:hypothetical protein